MAKLNTADIGFEDQIWKAADKMRGNLDASEYKSVVLGLIFLKYISDKFEARYKALVDEGEGFEEDKDEYTAENIFYVPTEARWSVIAAAAHTPEIGTTIDNAMRAIEKENRRLKDILPKNFARPELDKRRLGDVVDLFTNIKMHEHGDSKDILGRAYEYCLSKFAEADGLVLGSPIYFGEVTGKMRAFLERLAFPWLSYNDYSLTAPKRMPVVLVETMNGTPERNNSNHFGTMEWCLTTALGEPERIIGYNTCQVAKYDNYELGSFSEEAKHAWRDAHWEEDLQRAYDAGRKMAEQ